MNGGGDSMHRMFGAALLFAAAVMFAFGFGAATLLWLVFG